MKYYGNQIWNAATPSIRKATLLMDEAAFRILQQQLEQYRLNYYAAEKNGKVKMVINYNDSHDIQKLIGKKTASQIHWFPKSRHYVPPAFNIIGNTKYQELSQKSYIRGNTDLVLQVAKQLEEQGISFSGRIYNQNRATLTVQDKDQEKVLRFYHDISEKRAAQYQDAAALETVDISLPNLPQQTFDEILPYLKQTDISFSARAEKDHCIFSISQKDTGIFYQALVQAKSRSEFHKSLKELGFTEQQDAFLEPFSVFLATQEAEGKLTLDYTAYLNPNYSNPHKKEAPTLLSECFRFSYREVHIVGFIVQFIESDICSSISFQIVSSHKCPIWQTKPIPEIFTQLAVAFRRRYRLIVLLFNPKCKLFSIVSYRCKVQVTRWKESI